jgi:Flp pilus assembly protein TadD
VPKRKTSTLLFSLALAAALLVPHAALGGRFSEERAAGDVGATAATPAAEKTGTAEAAEADKPNGTNGTDEAQQPKRKGNAFARALSAPFRAIARLFGGGKSKAETAKKTTPATTQETAVTPTSQPDVTAQPAPAVAAMVEPLTTAPARATSQAARESASPAAQAGGARAEEGVRIVRPAEGEVVRELQPKMWIPKIVGIPSDPVSQGRALLQHGYIQEAVAELQTAATTGLPGQLAEANNLLGLAYDRLGWHLQAAEAYRRALSASPKDYVALTNLGYSLYLADDYTGALQHLKQAAKLAPNEPVIFNNLGVVNARLGRYGDAYKNFARGSGEYEAHVKLAGILEDQQRDKEAVKHYEAALRLQPGASAVLEHLVALYERTGERDKADTARRALSQPKNPQKTATGGGG